MAFHVQIDPQWEVGIIRYAGRVTGREVVSAVHALLSHPTWRPGYARYSDSSAVSVMDVMPDELEAMLLQEHAEHERIGGGRKAVVVPARLLDLSEMYRASIARSQHPYEMQVFVDGREAWDWLCGPCAADELLTRGYTL